MEDKDKIPYLYILIRRDLPVEVQMINIAHAASESIMEAPIPSTTRCVLLSVDNEAQLLEWGKTIEAKGHSYTIIYEPDEPYNGAAMSIGLTPSIKRNQLRKLFYHLETIKV